MAKCGCNFVLSLKYKIMNSIDFNHLFFILLNKNGDKPIEALDYKDTIDYSNPVVTPETDSRFIVNY